MCGKIFFVVKKRGGKVIQKNKWQFFKLNFFQEKINPINGSFIVSDLQMDKLYGITICAVMDPKNLTFPTFRNTSLNMKSKAHKIFIRSSGDFC